MSDDHNHSVNSSMLASMQQHQGGGAGHPHGGSIPSPMGDDVIGDGLKMQSKTLDPIQLGHGLDNEILGMFNKEGGALSRNPVTDVFDGTLVSVSEGSKINAFQEVMGGLQHEFKNTNMAHASPGEQLNIATTLGSQHNPSRGGAGH